ncbi:MAG TPA: FGGY-family carbohydrate kinase [Propionibacteriaceae bacterium]|nr:FGGY-family carbohydrate kinase [Propionibacteriaceae bacterium]
MNSYVTVDLGATSGRVVVGRLEQGRFELAEVHRFRNEPAGAGRELHWDAEELFAQTVIGLQRAAAQLDGAAASMGVTAWGVDVGLLDNNNKLLAPIQHYRAAGSDGAQAVLNRLGAEELFTRTGVLPQHINTVFRIRNIVDSAGAANRSEGVSALLIPDLWCAFLTGARTAERSIASTTGLLSLRTGTWDMDLVDAVGVDASILTRVVDNGVVVAELRKELAAGIGARDQWPFVLVASHDTASAAGAISGRPSTDRHSTAFVSSGTWSLVGVELAAPIVTSAALAAGFTNEAGLGGTTLFMRNLTGLWLLEQAIRQWQGQGRSVTITSLVQDAATVGQLQAAFDVSSPELVSSDDVLGAVRMQCRSAGMAPPETPAEVTRCILQSLALTYRRTISLCEQLTDKPVADVHMIGGGSLNPLLRQLTADACGRPLRFGPVEATSLGSLAAQAVAVGDLSDAADAQAVLQRSSDAGLLTPSDDQSVRRFWQQLDSIVPTPGSVA